jgi:hypothetical protein
VFDDLYLEEIQQGIQGLQAATSTPTAFYSMQEPLLSSSSADGQECPPAKQQHQQRPQ